MPFEIPTSNAGYTSFSTSVDQFVFSFNTYYNSVAQMWYCDIVIDGNTILQGAALTPDTNLFSANRGNTEQFGELRIIDLNGDENTTPESLGVNAQLIYYAPGEFQELFPNYNAPRPIPIPEYFSSLFTVVP